MIRMSSLVVGVSLLLFSGQLLAASPAQMVACRCSEAGFGARAVDGGVVGEVYVYNPWTREIRAFLVEDSSEPGQFIRKATEIAGDPEVFASIESVLEWVHEWADKTVHAGDVGLNYDSALELVGNDYAWALTASRAGIYAQDDFRSNLRMVLDKTLSASRISRMVNDIKIGASLTIVFPDGSTGALAQTSILHSMTDSSVKLRFEIVRLLDDQGQLIPTTASMMRYYNVDGRPDTFIQQFLSAAERLGIAVDRAQGVGTRSGEVLPGVYKVECDGSGCVITLIRGGDDEDD